MKLSTNLKKKVIYLHKLIPALISPLGIALFLIAIGLRANRRSYFLFSLLLLLLSALPIVSQSLWRHLEKHDRPVNLEETPYADAVVVLGGFADVANHKNVSTLHWSDPSRFFCGVDLVLANKAPKLIFMREKLPWHDSSQIGDLLRHKAIQIGVLENQIILSQPVTNTDDEAKATLEIAKEHGFKRFLLVTSSFHMFRAKLIFDSYGLSVLPYPCGSKALSKTSTWLDYIPNAGALDSTSRALREYLGRIYYRIKLSYT